MLFRQRISILIILALGLFLYFTISALTYYRQFEAERKQVQHTYEVLSHTQRLQALLQQDFTGNPIPTDAWRNAVIDELQLLQKLVHDNPTQSDRVDSLLNLFRQPIDQLSKKLSQPQIQLSNWQLTIRNIEREENRLLFQRDQSYQRISRKLVIYTLVVSICFSYLCW